VVAATVDDGMKVMVGIGIEESAAAPVASVMLVVVAGPALLIGQRGVMKIGDSAMTRTCYRH
jgi:hypothetical protein